MIVPLIIILLAISGEIKVAWSLTVLYVFLVFLFSGGNEVVDEHES